MKIITYMFLLLLFASGAFAQQTANRVGLRYVNWADSSRSNWQGDGPRPLRSVIWYPAGGGGEKEELNDVQQFWPAADVYMSAEVDSTKAIYPLIVISHGSQGSADKMQWLGYYLASKGYIAVAVSHNGTDEEELRRGGLTLSDFCMWERPRDVSAIIDKMLADKFFAGKINKGKIGAAGFSLGGTTAIWVAGAIFNKDRLAEKEPAIPERYRADVDWFTTFVKTNPIGIKSAEKSSGSFKDKRVKAVFALAPAIGGAFAPQGLQNITVPVQIVAGKDDIVNPMDPNAVYYTQNISTAKPLIVLPGERGHYTKPATGDERPGEMQEVAELAVNFFNSVL